MRDFVDAFYDGLGKSLGVITGIELALIILVVCSWVELPRLRVLEFKRYDEGTPAGSSSPSGSSESAAE